MFKLVQSVHNGKVYYYLAQKTPGSKKSLQSLGFNIPEESLEVLKSALDSINQEMEASRSAPPPLKQGDELLLLGEIYIKMALKDLGIFSLLEEQFKKDRAVHSYIDLYCSLVSARILAPGSILSEYEEKGLLFESFRLPETDIYRYLGFFDRIDDDIQKVLYLNAPSHFRNPAYQQLNYDGTNVFFHTAMPDPDIINSETEEIIKKGLRKHGFSKENRPLPIVQIGLFAADGGYPVAWNIFVGNEKEVSHIVPELRRIQKEDGVESFLFEADRANGSGKVLAFIQRVNFDERQKEYSKEHETDRYIVGKSIRQASDSLKEFALNPDGYEDVEVISPDSQVRQYKMKTREFQQTIRYCNNKGKETTTRIWQVQLVYRSDSYARREEHKRQEKIKKAVDLIQSISKLNNAMKKGDMRYVDLGGLKDKLISVGMDVDRIRQEREFDGYYAIISNLLDTAASILYARYHELHFNEEDFRILKSFLDLRPVYVYREGHIRAHVTICMTALVIVRYLQYLLGNKFSCQQIIIGLRDYFCVREARDYRVLYRNELIVALEEATSIRVEHEYMSYSDLQRLFAWKNLSAQLKLF